MSTPPRNVTLLAVAAIALGLAAWQFFGRSKAEGTVPSRSAHEAMCLACKQRVQVEHSVRDIAPFPCPKCGEKAAYTMTYCRDCRTIFVPGLVYNEFEKTHVLPMVPVCPKCGKSHTGVFDPRDPGQTPKGEPILPKWPP